MRNRGNKRDLTEGTTIWSMEENLADEFSVLLSQECRKYAYERTLNFRRKLSADS